MVRLVQLLCPERHCLMASAYEEERSCFTDACEGLRAMVKGGGFNAWCALCGSRELHFEEGVTKFLTLAEAMPSLMTEQHKNMAARQLLEATGQTYEKRRRN